MLTAYRKVPNMVMTGADQHIPRPCLARTDSPDKQKKPLSFWLNGL
jgi:hypothetical protein